MRPVSARWWETLREQWGKWDGDRERSGRCEKVLEHLRELGSGSQRGKRETGFTIVWLPGHSLGKTHKSSSAGVRWFQKRDCHPRIKGEPGNQQISPTPALRDRHSALCHYRLVLLLLWLGRKEITHYVVFGSWLLSLSIMHLRFIHVVSCLVLFLLLLSSTPLYGYTIVSFILPTVDGHLDFSSF